MRYLHWWDGNIEVGTVVTINLDTPQIQTSAVSAEIPRAEGRLSETEALPLRNRQVYPWLYTLRRYLSTYITTDIGLGPPLFFITDQC